MTVASQPRRHRRPDAYGLEEERLAAERLETGAEERPQRGRVAGSDLGEYGIPLEVPK